jgi:lipoprotein-anchoring transpeptidase ErfK/SrfK
VSFAGLRVKFGGSSGSSGRWRPGRRGGWIAATSAVAVAVLAVSVTVIASGHSSGSTSITNAADSHAKTSTTVSHPKKKPVAPLTLVSVTPSDGAAGVNGATSITVTFSTPLAGTTALPTLSPKISGNWSVSGTHATFTPAIGYRPGTHVTVKIPAGMTSSAGATLAQRAAARFTTGRYSTLRLQQLLAQLGYLPLTWSPTSGLTPGSSANAQLSAAYNPPTGTFTFNSGYPTALTSQWSVGSNNMIIQGAVQTFEYDQGLTMDGIAGPAVWQHLFTAVANQQTNKHGYTYVHVSQSGTETLTLWHDGSVRLTTPVNTGIAGRGTADGTYPVYSRFPVTIMSGTNPDGSKYHDTVQWVSYFNGGDAVHYFARPGYGYYQSLGCVELPYDPAVRAYNLMYYGTLVTVTGPEA